MRGISEAEYNRLKNAQIRVLCAGGGAIAVIGGIALGTAAIGLYASGAFGIFEGMRQWGRARRLTGALLVVGGSSAALAAVLLIRLG